MRAQPWLKLSRPVGTIHATYDHGRADKGLQPIHAKGRSERARRRNHRSGEDQSPPVGRPQITPGKRRGRPEVLELVINPKLSPVRTFGRGLTVDCAIKPACVPKLTSLTVCVC